MKQRITTTIPPDVMTWTCPVCAQVQPLRLKEPERVECACGFWLWDEKDGTWQERGETIVECYHVFTDWKDWTFGLDEWWKALGLFNKWAREYGRARLYLVRWPDNDQCEELEYEEPLRVFGDFPT